MAAWAARRLDLGIRFCDYQLSESVEVKERSVRWLKSCWPQGIREKFKYSPGSIRSYRRLSDEHLRGRMALDSDSDT